MKKTLKYILPLAVLLIMAQCSKDFLDLTPQDRITADGFYRTADEVRSGTASLYGYPWFSFNDKFFWLAGDGMAGNIYYTYQEEGQFYYFTLTAGNVYLSDAWKSLFRVISYANSIINDMPAIAESNGVDQDAINAALGEAHFIRGTAYYMLAEFWGEVPIVENSTELVTSNNMMLPKNTRSSIYEFIRRDLQYASENLPTADAQAGRVTQWSAKGMLAKLYLTMAQSGGSTASENFNQAKTLSDDVITNSGLSLLSDYHDLFLLANNNNQESLFSLQWMKGGYGLGNSRNANWARSSIIADQQWGGGKGCTYDFQSIVDSGDLRRKEIYMTLGDTFPELNIDSGGYIYYFERLNPENPDNALESPNDVLNHLKKYVVGRATDNDGEVGSDQDAGNNTYILRLADLYLIYAEATLGTATTTTDAKALGYFNTIRERAGLDPLASLTFENILKERRVEFCLESMFWFDIKRYFYRDPAAAVAYLNAQKRHWIYRATPADDDANLWTSYNLDPDFYDPVVVSNSDMYLPVPTEEIITNPLLGPDEPAVEYEFSE